MSFPITPVSVLSIHLITCIHVYNLVDGEGKEMHISFCSSLSSFSFPLFSIFSKLYLVQQCGLSALWGKSFSFKIL